MPMFGEDRPANKFRFTRTIEGREGGSVTLTCVLREDNHVQGLIESLHITEDTPVDILVSKED